MKCDCIEAETSTGKTYPDFCKTHKKAYRKKVWYGRFKRFVEILNDHKYNDVSLVESLEGIHQIIDEARGFNYDHVSWSAFRQMLVVAEDEDKE